jgi:hypothetical protein
MWIDLTSVVARANPVAQWVMRQVMRQVTR